MSTRFNGLGSIAREVLHAFDARFAHRWFSCSGLLSNFLVDRSVLTSAVSPVYAHRVLAFAELVSECTAESEFLNNARNLEGQSGAAKYWTKPSELCARAFEAYIQDSLDVRNVNHQWLALGARENDYLDNGMHPYPQRSDRLRINAVMARCIPIIFGRN